MAERGSDRGAERRSPFPGMDPYLEDPSRWPGMHGGLITLIRLELNRLLGPSFVADAGSTVYIIAPEEWRWAFPDVFVVMQASRARLQAEAPGRLTAPVQVAIATPTSIEQPYIVIRDRASREVVTVVEVISPINKAPAHTEARQEFLRKRADVMASGTHWVEVDLLRAGERPAEVRGAGDYYALVKRAGSSMADVWPIGVRDRLPPIGIPLRGADDVVVDLQTIFDRLYAEGRYADLIDYAGSPPPPALPLSDQQWVGAQLGRRSPAAG